MITQMLVNHLGPWLLTALLLPTLKDTGTHARPLCVSRAAALYTYVSNGLVTLKHTAHAAANKCPTT